MRKIIVEISKLSPGTLISLDKHIHADIGASFSKAKIHKSSTGKISVQEINGKDIFVTHKNICMFLGWYPYHSFEDDVNYVPEMCALMLCEGHTLVSNVMYFERNFQLLPTAAV